jgi:hypothetical protein
MCALQEPHGSEEEILRCTGKVSFSFLASTPGVCLWGQVVTTAQRGKFRGRDGDKTKIWIPASAGMTDQKQRMGSRLCGNDGHLCHPPEHVTLCEGFARRKRGSTRRTRTAFLFQATAPFAWAESAGGVRVLVKGSRTYHFSFSLPAEPIFVLYPVSCGGSSPSVTM